MTRVTIRDMKIVALLSALVLACAPLSADAAYRPAPPVCSEPIFKAQVVSEAVTASTPPDLTTVKANTYQLQENTAEFCRDFPKATLCRGHTVWGPGKLTLREVTQIDQGLRASFRYVSDDVLYKEDDHWATNVSCGDCEDYALTLSERLASAGQAGSEMSLMLWFPLPGAAHATLLVQTADAGTIEVGVGDGGKPAPMDWSYGIRVAYMPMDGGRRWMLVAPPWVRMFPPKPVINQK